MVAPTNVMLVGAVVVTVPPQAATDALATVNPAGKVSVKPTPVRVVVAFGLVIVNVRLVVLPSAIVVGLKDFAIEGGAMIVIMAFDVFPVPPSVELMVTLLFFAPAEVPVTLSETVHEPLAATVPPVRLTELDPATAAAAPHVLSKAFGVATTRPDGSASVKLSPVSAAAGFGFVMVNVRLELPLRGTVAAPNALTIAGGATTVIEAFAVFP